MQLPLARELAAVILAIIDQVEPELRNRHRIWTDAHPSAAVSDLLHSASENRPDKRDDE
jgi:hypothetical protein